MIAITSRRRRKLFASLGTAVAIVLFLVCVVRKDDRAPRRSLVALKIEKFENNFSFRFLADENATNTFNAQNVSHTGHDDDGDDHDEHEKVDGSHDEQDHEEESHDDEHNHEDGSHDEHDLEDSSHDEHDHKDEELHNNEHNDEHNHEDESHDDEHSHEDESHDDEHNHEDGSHDEHDLEDSSHDEHDHESESHEGHDHEEDEHDQEDGSHDGHDHEVESHDGHDHGEEGSHDGHDHEEGGSHDGHDQEEEGSHDGHDHEEGSHDEHDHKEGESHDERNPEEEGSHDGHDLEEEGSHDGHDHKEEGSHDGHDHAEEGSHDGHDHEVNAEVNAAIRDSPADKENKNKNWEEAIGAAFLVNLTTLIGVCFLVPATMFGRMMKFSKSSREVFLEIMIPSFACGALIATALFLMIPESLLYLALEDGADPHDGHDHRYLEEDEDNDDEEGGASWKFGASVLGGYFIPFLSSFLFPHHHVDEVGYENVTTQQQNDTATNNTTDNDEEAVPVVKRVENNQYEKNYPEEEEDDDPEIDVDTGIVSFKQKEVKPIVASNDNYGKNAIIPVVNSHPIKQSREMVVEATEVNSVNLISKASAIDWNLASAILLGDFMHNFVDGIFIGVGFILCDVKFGWTIAFSTIWHELSQEVADFFLLVNQCGFSVFKALLFNFISGLSVVMGVLVILGTDLQQGPVIGSLLAIGSGVYFYLSLTEIAPRTKQFLSTRSRGMISLFMWICGAVPIGLVLLNHAHC